MLEQGTGLSKAFRDKKVGALLTDFSLLLPTLIFPPQIIIFTNITPTVSCSTLWNFPIQSFISPHPKLEHSMVAFCCGMTPQDHYNAVEWLVSWDDRMTIILVASGMGYSHAPHSPWCVFPYTIVANIWPGISPVTFDTERVASFLRVISGIGVEAVRFQVMGKMQKCHCYHQDTIYDLRSWVIYVQVHHRELSNVSSTSAELWWLIFLGTLPLYIADGSASSQFL